MNSSDQRRVVLLLTTVAGDTLARAYSAVHAGRQLGVLASEVSRGR